MPDSVARNADFCNESLNPRRDPLVFRRDERRMRESYREARSQPRDPLRLSKQPPSRDITQEGAINETYRIERRSGGAFDFRIGSGALEDAGHERLRHGGTQGSLDRDRKSTRLN